MVKIERGYGEGLHGDKWHVEWVGGLVLAVSHVCANQDQLVKADAHGSNGWACPECGALFGWGWAREIIKGSSEQGTEGEKAASIEPNYASAKLFGVVLYGYDYEGHQVVAIAASLDKARCLADQVVAKAVAAVSKELNVGTRILGGVTDKDMFEGLLLYPWNDIAVVALPTDGLLDLTGCEILYAAKEANKDKLERKEH